MNGIYFQFVNKHLSNLSSVITPNVNSDGGKVEQITTDKPCQYLAACVTQKNEPPPPYKMTHGSFLYVEK